MDPTEITNDAAFHISISHVVELYGAIAALDSATFPSGATNLFSSATTSTRIHYTTAIHYNITKVTFIHTAHFHVSNPQRLSCTSMRDPSHATLETGRGFPRYR